MDFGLSVFVIVVLILYYSFLSRQRQWDSFIMMLFWDKSHIRSDIDIVEYQVLVSKITRNCNAITLSPCHAVSPSVNIINLEITVHHCMTTLNYFACIRFVFAFWSLTVLEFGVIYLKWPCLGKCIHALTLTHRVLLYFKSHAFSTFRSEPFTHTPKRTYRFILKYIKEWLFQGT